jgi:hypothetical protein
MTVVLQPNGLGADKTRPFLFTFFRASALPDCVSDNKELCALHSKWFGRKSSFS